MKCSPQSEWQIQPPWGELTLTSWGNPRASPAFLVHGRQDCAATFQPLLDLLDPEEYYYVSIDMPGSANSSPFPVGVKILRFQFVAAMEAAIEHLGWDKFVFIGHSMGSEIGLFYNSVNPGRITKMVLCDPEPTFRRLQVRDLPRYQATFYDNYYNNYMKDNFYYRTYTMNEAKQALMRARNLTDEKASILLKSSLKHVQGDQYRFTWDRRLKSPAPQNYPNSYYFAIFSNIPPTLVISASDSLREQSQSGSLELLNMLSTLENVNHVTVEGSHDVHLTNPERLAPHIIKFLKKETKVNCKL